MLHAIGLLLARTPALVNTRHPETGASLLHCIVRNTNLPKLVQLLIEAPCSIALGSGSMESTLSMAIRQGKLSLLQLLLEAPSSRTFSRLPSSMRFISSAFEPLAAKYPHAFLALIRSTQLQSEPEVLGESTTHDVLLPKLLVQGSQQRCPLGLWADVLKVSPLRFPSHEPH